MDRIISLALGLLLAGLAQAADMTGSADHPSIPRVAGSEIAGYAHSEYDAANMLLADAQGKLVVQNPEGTRTRILYVLKAGDTPTMAMRNYEVALGELGEVTEVYSCRNDCRGHTFSTTLWTRDTMVPTEGLAHPHYLLGFSHNYGSTHYRYAQVVAEQSKFHIGVFAATLAGNNSNADLRNRTVVLLEVLEIKDFEPTLEFVDADTMHTEISQSGHIALYGIQFNHNEATLTADSESTVAEIVKALQADAGLKLYVVGHTDDVGALEYNNDLSLRRATTVVDALVAQGVAADRLTPIGVGPVAPISSNDNEQGRALNRRVELVKRALAK